MYYVSHFVATIVYSFHFIFALYFLQKNEIEQFTKATLS